MKKDQFDLDVRTSSTQSSQKAPAITSISLCTPGCPTGAIACFTRTVTCGCPIVVSAAEAPKTEE